MTGPGSAHAAIGSAPPVELVPALVLQRQATMEKLNGANPVEMNGRHPTRVFVGEDDVEMRVLMASALRRDGHEVIEVADGRELLRRVQALQASTPRMVRDIVVTDVRMPGASGLEVLAVLRVSSPCIPVILVTGFGDNETHLVASRLGAVMVFDKPFRMDALQAVVRHLAAGIALAKPAANTNGVS